MTGPQPANTGAGDRDRWRAVRRDVNQRRHQLAAAAAGLYPGVPRVGTAGLLCREDWLPPGPVDLDEVHLRWTEAAPPPLMLGSSPESAGLRPRNPGGEPFGTYADALAALDPPALFENRPAYRLLAARLDVAAGGSYLDFARGRYFDAVSVGEALAHELAVVWPGGGAVPGLDALPF